MSHELQLTWGCTQEALWCGRALESGWAADAASSVLQGVSWVVDLVKLALKPGLAPGVELPIVLFFDELEQLNATMWMGFDRVLYIHDRCGLCSLGMSWGWARKGCGEGPSTLAMPLEDTPFTCSHRESPSP